MRRETFREASYDEKMPVHQQEMMEACETGDVRKLQRLFGTLGVRTRNSTVQRVVDVSDRTGPPTTFEMLNTAIVHNRPMIVQLLLRIYPDTCVESDTLLGATRANPDLPTLKILCSHQPSIVNYAMCKDDLRLDTLLLDYCHYGDPRQAAYLLDNGADPNEGGLPHFGGPLTDAITSGQPPSLIHKFIQCRARILPLHAIFAVRDRRTDILEVLLEHCQWDAHGSASKNKERLLFEAHETKNEELISLVKTHLNKRKDNKNWWQFWL